MTELTMDKQINKLKDNYNPSEHLHIGINDAVKLINNFWHTGKRRYLMNKQRTER